MTCTCPCGTRSSRSPMADTEAGEPAQDHQLAGQAVGDDDPLARQIIYDLCFEDGVVGANALLQFIGNRNADGSFDESLHALSMISPKDLHAIGCAGAVLKNDRQQLKRVKQCLEPSEPVSGEDRRYYCG